MSENLLDGSNNIFITDGGLETDMIFNRGLDLPEFAAFTLLAKDEGKQHLRDYFESYVKVAKEHKHGYILDSPTWRASIDWGKKLGFDQNALDDLNREAIKMFKDIKEKYEDVDTPILISGQLGPNEDGYALSTMMTVEEVEQYHTRQIEVFKESGVDFITILTARYVEEAVGIINVCKKLGMPVVISFTTETDGTIPSGKSLKEAIESVDAMTDGYTSYFMINCSHPDHFIESLNSDEDWTKRIKGLRANASSKSHEELDESETIDAGNKQELSLKYNDVRKILPELTVIGGCCGTDHTHIEEIVSNL